MSFKPDGATTPEPDLAISPPEANAYLAMLCDYRPEVVLDQHEPTTRICQSYPDHAPLGRQLRMRRLGACLEAVACEPAARAQ